MQQETEHAGCGHQGPSDRYHQPDREPGSRSDEQDHLCHKHDAARLTRLGRKVGYRTAGHRSTLPELGVPVHRIAKVT